MLPGDTSAPGTGLLVRLRGELRRTHGGPGCEVAPCPAVAQVPGGVAPWLVGLVMHKGEALPLVDLAVALDEAAGAGAVEHRRMLVSHAAGLAVAWLVDDVDADDGRPGVTPLDLDGLVRRLLGGDAPPAEVLS